jgi:hypothetical protein
VFDAEMRLYNAEELSILKGNLLRTESSIKEYENTVATTAENIKAVSESIGTLDVMHEDIATKIAIDNERIRLDKLTADMEVRIKENLRDTIAIEHKIESMFSGAECLCPLCGQVADKDMILQEMRC